MSLNKSVISGKCPGCAMYKKRLEAASEALLALPPRPGKWRLQKIAHNMKEDKNEHAT